MLEFDSAINIAAFVGLSVVQEAACQLLDQDNPEQYVDMACVFRHLSEPFYSVSYFYSRLLRELKSGWS